MLAVMFVGSTAVVLVLVVLILNTIKWIIDRHTLNKMPGPKSYYLIGNLLDIYGTADVFFNKIRFIHRKFKICRMWMSYISGVFTYRPQDIELVLGNSHNITKGRVYEPLIEWLQTGLLTSTGRKWHVRRKMLTPSFHFEILQQFLEVFGRHAEELVKKLDRHVEEPYIDIVPYVTECALHSVVESAMGVRLNRNDRKQNIYVSAVSEFAELFVFRIVRPWLYPALIWRLSPHYWFKQRRVIKTLHNFTDNVIQERRKTFDPKDFENTSDFISKRKRLAMLDLLLMEKDIDDIGIREEVDTFVFEGHDTTSLAMSYVLLLLASYPEHQENVYEEILNVFGYSDRSPTYYDLQNMSYLERCIKESLRLYPSVPSISRVVGVDLKTFDGYDIPKGAIVFINIYDLHHDPDIYPNPEKFDPDRFLPENIKDRHPFAYMPFSAGSRNCIGQKFAILEIKTVILAILRRYKLVAVDIASEKTLLQDMMLRPKNGIKIKFERRDSVIIT